MLSKNTSFTIISKFVILLINFSMMVFSTHVWGSAGRGEIALVLANISIISIFSNVFCGSTVAYHAPGQPRDFLLTLSLAGALVISFTGTLIFSIIFGFRYFLFLFIISLLMSIITAVSLYWLGKNSIRNYNILTVLNPLIILIFLIILFFVFNKTTIDVYFRAYYIGAGTTLIIAVSVLLIKQPFKVPALSFKGIKEISSYGLKNEFNYFLQFLNYRLSYYFIARLLGLSLLGIFSIAVSITEAVWIISRSMSVIHFSNVINSDDQLKNMNETKAFVRQSFLISLIIIVISVFIPTSVYQFIFGEEFTDVRRLIIYLTPGIMAIAVSNLYGHYFAGTGKLKIVRDKSIIGLVSTIILLPLLINKYQLPGVCLSLNVSYLLSSLYLWYKFRRELRSSEEINTG